MKRDTLLHWEALVDRVLIPVLADRQRVTWRHAQESQTLRYWLARGKARRRGERAEEPAKAKTA